MICAKLDCMSPAEQLIEAALKLPEDDRAKLLESVSASLDGADLGDLSLSVSSPPRVCYHPLVRSDTSPDAMRAQIEAQRRLGGAQRFRTACMMSQTLRDLAIARIRAMHPELDERGILDQLLADLYGFRRIT